MIIEQENQEFGRVQHLPNQARPTIVSDELRQIMATLHELCPPEATISFHFDGKLHVHIDVRDLERVMLIEAMLPLFGAGMFHDIQRGSSPHQPFFHRVSALVDR